MNDMNKIFKKVIDLNVATHEISTMLKLVKFKDDVNYVIQNNPIFFYDFDVNDIPDQIVTQ